MEVEHCTSCGRGLVGDGWVIFKCPNCGEGVIARCKNCRDQAIEYACPVCGWRGP